MPGPAKPGPVAPLIADPEAEIARIATSLRETLGGTLGRRGFVVAISGGIDSAVCAGLAARAVGPGKVLGLLLPEHESDPLSTRLGRAVAEAFKIPWVIEEIGPTLDALGCYRRRDEAIRRLVPEFGEGWGCKIVTPTDRLEADSLNVPALLVQPPSGPARRIPLPAREYREIIAATNFKQRIRKVMDYYHADRLHYAVIGTPNRLEYDQGFFVKGGDGLADVKPIAHLYKSQVYQLGAVLGVPEEILQRTPTTDTFSLPQTQEEFFFGLPYSTLDAVLHARNAGWSVAEAADRLGLPQDAVARTWGDLAQKRATTRYLHLHSLLVEDVDLSEDTD